MNGILFFIYLAKAKFELHFLYPQAEACGNSIKAIRKFPPLSYELPPASAGGINVFFQCWL